MEQCKWGEGQAGRGMGEVALREPQHHYPNCLPVETPPRDPDVIVAPGPGWFSPILKYCLVSWQLINI